MSNEEERAKILEKIRALAALANPENNPFEHEVATASAMMQKLMDQYNISLADVMLTEKQQTVDRFSGSSGVVILGSLKRWHWGLGRVIGRITGTQSFASGRFGKTARDPNGKNKHGHAMSFFGAPASTAVACQLFDEWVITIDKMASIAVKQYIADLTEELQDEMDFYEVKQVRHLNLGYRHPNIWRDSWLAGVISGIDASLHEQEAQRDQQTSTALAVISKELVVAYSDFASGFKKVSTSGSSGNSGAFNAGHGVGKGMSLTAKKLNG